LHLTALDDAKEGMMATLIEQIEAGIKDGTLQQSDVLSALHRAGEAPACTDMISEARETYCDDETEIDDEPLVSLGDDGGWVSAWVWVRNKDADGC
jgi:hypothetical protein